MDLGFEGNFIAHHKSFPQDSKYIDHSINKNWVMLKKTKFKTVFANDIPNEAEVAWTTYMSRFGYQPEMYHNISIVDLVKMHKQGADIFPKDIDVVTGGFPCQDFSVAGKLRDSIPTRTTTARSEKEMSHQKKHVANYTIG